MKNSKAVSFFLSALLGALSTTAAAVSEVENNGTIASPQALAASSVITINGMMGGEGVTTRDIDFYSFSANQGDVLTIDIDNGYGNGETLNTIIAIFSTDTGGRRRAPERSINPGKFYPPDFYHETLAG